MGAWPRGGRNGLAVFGMKIAALPAAGPKALGERMNWSTTNYAPAQLNELIAASDYLLLATPLTPETQGHDRRGANRGADKAERNFDQHRPLPAGDRRPALIAALKASKIRGAALDVFTVEPSARRTTPLQPGKRADVAAHGGSRGGFSQEGRRANAPPTI